MAMIMSFTWTTKAFMTGAKTVTRRMWSDGWAARFRAGEIVQAYDRSPRNGGKRVAWIRLVSVRKEPLTRLLEDRAYGEAEIRREGGLWASIEAFIELFGGEDKVPWRVEFEKLREGPDGVETQG